jgi:hypothetical protein
MYQCQPALERPKVSFSEFYDRRNMTKSALMGRSLPEVAQKPGLAANKLSGKRHGRRFKTTRRLCG